MQTRRYKFRLGLITLTFILLLILICTRIIYIQFILGKNKLNKLAQSQHYIKIDLDPQRGAILDRNMHKLAVNLRVDSVYAVARDVKEKRRTADLLAPILEKDPDFLYKRLRRDKLFVWLARKISKDKAKKVRELKLAGIYLLDETKRFYPNGSLASHVIGFSGTDNVGLEGIEQYYDKYMRGEGGSKSIVRDAKGREIYAFGETYIAPIHGSSVVLTIDQVIQHISEKALKKACSKYHAKAGICVVMDPFSGGILALAVEPNYDLNNFFNTSDDQRRNRAIADCYEPGSVFKVVTASACLENKTVSPEDKFFCENGSWYVAGHTLHDYHGYGDLTFSQVIQKSSNIGTVKAAMKLGNDRLYKQIEAYGFGSFTGIDLPGEIAGIVRPVHRWSKYSITAIPMGQEVAVTPMQLARSLSAIANGGELVKPHIVNKIIDSNGQVIKDYEPSANKRVMSEETSKTMKYILKGAVEHGTGKRAKPKEFDACGKTGTAQKAEPGKGYVNNKYVASFVGFAPYDDPILSICVMIDEPQPVHTGGTVSAPVFKEIAQASLSYLKTTKTAYAERLNRQDHNEKEKIVEARL